jgi:DNA polymerase I-like protein with 3'-5' exonuclease and polymerase domains
MVWRDLPWTGDPKEDRKIADRQFYREFSYRDMAKRGGHGTNYRGQAPTISKTLNVEQKVIEDFQRAYFTAFPAIPAWHRSVVEKLQLTGRITTFLGRERHFFGRLHDDATIREAIAFEPQSVVGDVMNEAIRRLPSLKHSQLIAQIHDAVVFQYPEQMEHEVLSCASDLLRVPLTIANRTFTIPVEVSSGWNWGKREEHKDGKVINPDGLRKYKFSSPDTRTRLVAHDTPLLLRPLW